MASSRVVRLLLHALLTLIPVAYFYGAASGKSAEAAAVAKMIDALPPACQERMGRLARGPEAAATRLVGAGRRR